MKKVALIILDWVWINEETPEENALKLWNTPMFDKLFWENKYSKLKASWEQVGVIDWYMWNSEVWHLTIGSWRIVKQSIVEINHLFKENKFREIEEFKKIEASNKDKKIHLIWIIWFSWVHGFQEHFYEFIKILGKDRKLSLHLISDWRDSWIKDSLSFIHKLEEFLKDYKNVEISSIWWRYYAMDRDNNWERSLKYYNALIWEVPTTKLSLRDYVEKSYQDEIYDEFIEPVCFEGKSFIKDGDISVVLNFRPDRAKQITEILNWDLKEENYTKVDSQVYTMTKYYDEFSWNIFIKKALFKNTLWELVSKSGLRQLHLAETEKFAHVTKYFNWLKTSLWEWENHILIASKKVKTYDLCPEMSAFEILDTFKQNSDNFDFFVINYANWDMVWHTWDLKATIKAVETLDQVLKEMIELSREKDIDLLIIADHWNCENMWLNWEKNTSHTTNSVPCFYISSWESVKIKTEWWLSDVTPTILDIIGIKKTKEITWTSLIF